MMRKLTISALSAALMCTSVYAQEFRTEASKSPLVKTATNEVYSQRSQLTTGIPTVYLNIFDGKKTGDELDSIGQDYKVNSEGVRKPNGNIYQIYDQNNNLVDICNSYIASMPEKYVNMRETQWENYYKNTWAPKSESYDIARIQIIDGSGSLKVRDEMVKLRGRGNSTWIYPKRAFRLKFPSKTALLAKGDGTNEHADSKNWTLIANAYDRSQIMNALGAEVGKYLGLPFNASYKFVDLVINGEYRGCYQISDHISIGGRRIDIDEKEGWLMEMVSTNQNFIENPYITTKLKTSQYSWEWPEATINIKNPNVHLDNSESDTIQAIKAWFENIEFYDHSEETGFRNYIDIYSLASYLAALDITGNYDGTISNYMYRDKGTESKLKFGPLWDNDLSFGNFGDTKNKLARDGFGKGSYYSFPAFVRTVMEDAVFMKALKRKYDSVYDNLESFINNKVNEIVTDALEISIQKNDNLWGSNTNYGIGSSTNYANGNYSDAIYGIRTFCQTHLPYIKNQYDSYYNALKTTSTVMIDASTSNSSTSPFSSVSNKICTTYVQNKSFAADTWTTICLPFNLDEDELKSYFGDNMQLAEYTRLDGAGTLMVFNKMDSPLLIAGVPYLIKPSKAVSNPTFKEVVLSIQTPKTVKISSSDAVGFTGTFYKTSIPTANVSTLQGTDFNKYTGGNLEGLSAYVSGSSVVSLRIEGEETTPAIAMGDVNEDGQVSILDLTTMINHILGSTPAVFNTTAADMNGDGEVTVVDVTMLINLILSQEKE